MSICLTNKNFCAKINLYEYALIQFCFKEFDVRTDLTLPDIPRSWRAVKLKTAADFLKPHVKGIKK